MLCTAVFPVILLCFHFRDSRKHSSKLVTDVFTAVFADAKYSQQPQIAVSTSSFAQDTYSGNQKHNGAHGLCMFILHNPMRCIAPSIVHVKWVSIIRLAKGGMLVLFILPDNDLRSSNSCNC